MGEDWWGHEGEASRLRGGLTRAPARRGRKAGAAPTVRSTASPPAPQLALGPTLASLGGARVWM